MMMLTPMRMDSSLSLGVKNEFVQPGIHGGLVLAQAGRPPVPVGQQLLPLAGDTVHKRLERLGKGRHAILLQLPGDGFQVHSQASQAGQLILYLLQVHLQVT